MVKNIAFIGAGNMAGAIIKGLLEQDYPADAIQATTRTAASAERAAQQLGIKTSTDNTAVAQWAEVIVLAVKPQMLQATCEALRGAINTQLIVSVAAGIDTTTLSRWLGGEVAIVRSMPNTPSQVGVGASGLYANEHAGDEDKAFAGQIATATGLCVWVENEAQMHAITAVSGSGPAYYFLFMEAMINAGVNLGLPSETARQLTLQTALGAATLAARSDVPVDELKRRVMSPGGTTERAINAFDAGNLPALVEQAMNDCAARSQTLSEELAK